jgi:hypothetical protein
MTGRRLGNPVLDTAEKISAGLTQRLANYAVARCNDAGFGPIIKDAAVEVYTTDGDDIPSRRSYCVGFKTEKGGYIALVGILTRNGWPSLDHGFDIGEA